MCSIDILQLDRKHWLKIMSFCSIENLKEFWLKESCLCNIQYCSPHLTTSHSEIYNFNSSAASQLYTQLPFWLHNHHRASINMYKWNCKWQHQNDLFKHGIINRIGSKEVFPLRFSFEWFVSFRLKFQRIPSDGFEVFGGAKAVTKRVDAEEGGGVTIFQTAHIIFNGCRVNWGFPQI